MFFLTWMEYKNLNPGKIFKHVQNLLYSLNFKFKIIMNNSIFAKLCMFSFICFSRIIMSVHCKSLNFYTICSFQCELSKGNLYNSLPFTDVVLTLRLNQGSLYMTDFSNLSAFLMSLKDAVFYALRKAILTQS